MLFNSIDFLLFFPLAAIFYFVLPKKLRNLFLLGCSLYFYMCWKAKYILLIGFSILVTYAAGLLMDALEQRQRQGLKKLVLAGTLTANLLVLFVFKYYNFFVENIEKLSQNRLMLPLLRFALPVGISFYTFQALGYAIDVYRKAIRPEKNLFVYALFVSFFPQLVAGPIERSSNLLPQMHTAHSFCFEDMRSGLLLMGWGFFQKLVIADRLALFVNGVYASYDTVDGAYLFLATVLFAFQIYCDFGSYSNIAIGAARVLGFRLMKNFDTPFFAKNIAEFWSRWHISLSTWFQDYLFEPMVWSSRNPQKMTLVALAVVFLTSGLWHGASWTYVLWGALHAIYRIVGVTTRKKRRKLYKKLHIDLKSRYYALGQGLTTFLLVCFTFIFFRAESTAQAFGVVGRIFTNFHLGALFNSAFFTFGLDLPDLVVAVLALLVLLAADVSAYRKRDVYHWVTAKPLVLRWALYWGLLFVIVIFGVYGPSYDSAPFIYFQF